MQMKLSNGVEAFVVESTKPFHATDASGAAYRLCNAGPNCDHGRAPDHAQVWHDAEHTETLWLMREYLCLANPWTKKPKQPSLVFWLYEVESTDLASAGAIAMRCAEIAVQLDLGNDALVAPTIVLVDEAGDRWARKWEGEYDTWPASYCADIAARYGVATEAGRR